MFPATKDFKTVLTTMIFYIFSQYITSNGSYCFNEYVNEDPTHCRYWRTDMKFFDSKKNPKGRVS